MELRRTTREQVAELRAAKLLQTDLSVSPGFYTGLADEAEPFLIVEGAVSAGGGLPGAAAAKQAETVLGYALLLNREHDGHVHTTLVELGMSAEDSDRYEDVLDVIRDTVAPVAYLVRTDDCGLNAALLARGLQVEATALVLVPQRKWGAVVTAAPAPPEDGPPGAELSAGRSRAAGVEAPEPRLGLFPLSRTHVAAVAGLLSPDEPEEGQPGGHHRHGPTAEETLDQVRALADTGEAWVLQEDGAPQAVLARLRAEKGGYELLDFVVAQGEEAGLAWAFSRVTEEVMASGRRPVAVIDALDPVRRRIVRSAGYYTAAAYVVFYDPVAGRPSVPTVTLEDVQGMIKRKERFHLVDVMGEEHWKAGHLPGSEWIDFRGLGREARKRYKQDDTIVVYCNGFT